jgi:hypothetical protein
MQKAGEDVACFFILACAASLLFIPIISNTHIPAMWDVVNHLAAIVQAKMALAEHQWFLRTTPSGHYSSFRYPFFQFYSPTSYTIAGWINRWVIPENPFVAFKCTLWIALFFGGVYIYRLSVWLLRSRSIALLSAMVYLMAPYQIIIVNYMGAFNEVIALGLIPIVIYYTLQCYYRPFHRGNILSTAFVWYLLLTVHFVTFVYFSIFFAIFLLILSKNPFRKLKELGGVAVSYVFGSMLAMWYLAPIVLYTKYLFVYFGIFDKKAPELYASFLTNLLSPIAIFSPGVVSGTQSSLIDRITMIHPSVGLPILMAVFFSGYLIIYKKENKNLLLLTPLFFVFLIVFFAVWSPIDFWQWLPHPLVIMQYSWRLLGQTLWIGALLFSYALYWLFPKGLTKKQVFIGIFLIVATSTSWFFMPNNKKVQINIVNFNQPYVVFNPDVYLIDYRKMGMDIIDQISLKAFIWHILDTEVLNIGETVSIPSALLKNAFSLYLQLDGIVYQKKTISNQQLNFGVNNKLVATHQLKPGNVAWTIPINNLNFLNNDFVFFRFTSENKVLDSVIKVNALYLSGFLNPKTTLSLKQLASSDCIQKEGETICHIDVPLGVKLLELPAFYYPNMLNIMVNGKAVPYKSVLVGGYLLVGIQPAEGVTNNIQISFQGLLWANFISYGAWFLLLIFSVFLLLRKLFPSLR